MLFDSIIPKSVISLWERVLKENLTGVFTTLFPTGKVSSEWLTASLDSVGGAVTASNMEYNTITHCFNPRASDRCNSLAETE